MDATLNLNVIAEGVETDVQIVFFQEHQCNEMQCYYFSKLIPGDEFAQLLHTKKHWCAKMYLNDTIKKIGGSHLPFGNVMEYGGGREN